MNPFIKSQLNEHRLRLFTTRILVTQSSSTTEVNMIDTQPTFTMAHCIDKSEVEEQTLRRWCVSTTLAS